MRLDWFWVEDFKNLKDVTIDFDESHWVTVVIGWNGTGKSNVLEALATLFRDLIMIQEFNGSRKPTFKYKLVYKCQNNLIAIDADPDRAQNAYRISVRDLSEQLQPTLLTSNSEDYFEPIFKQGKILPLAQFIKRQEEYLPRNVFGYYSGYAGRMEEIFQPYLEKYDKELRGGKDPGFKRLFFALPIHSQFVLLAFVLKHEQMVKDFLEKLLFLDPVDGIESVLFVLRKPGWANSKKKGGDERFWRAEGVVKEFLVRLYDIALAPIRITREKQITLWNKSRIEFIYLFVKDMDALRTLVGEREPRSLFRDIESTFVSEMIEEIRIKIRLRDGKGKVTFRELSEGEQQLLTVLGLLCFTAEDQSLFLLDEPDTHLNPRWSADYLEYLKRFVGSDEEGDEHSHILFTTHNPLAIAELVKEQVQVLRRSEDELKTSVHTPADDPRGMGYSGIVTSDMFGLAAALDSHTLKLLERRRKLTLTDDPLTDEAREELAQINRELEPYGFRHEARDPIFREYLRARFEYDKNANKSELTPVDALTKDERQALAKELVQKALGQQG
ncbi:ATP-binding protein [Nitratidesulfovibrio vulgaris]|uniref:SMC domain protein n=1 Tax=Nitratidesulfovibrio vulgaris (strain DP4) TaxID=391774 RepID=A0A0H3A6G8_NITV4|nr:ATP-binding protein [Nitratidesulfovibrio vulgaris]ABM27876.1 SMC domain protein [Nitratidesulfovibrio vulgaris DP4]